MKRITSTLTICTFVFFLLAEPAVAERCLVHSVDCPKEESKSAIHPSHKPSVSADSDGSSAGHHHHHHHCAGISSPHNVTNYPCCADSITVQERNLFLTEHHSQTSVESRATCSDYSPSEEVHCFSHDSVTVTCDCIHYSIPVTVLLR